jgi:hypothetical protein
MKSRIHNVIIINSMIQNEHFKGSQLWDILNAFYLLFEKTHVKNVN